MVARPTDSVHPGSNPAQGIAPLPMQILRARNLSMGAKLLYADLQHYAWRTRITFPTFAQLAQDLGMSEHSIHKWMQELMKARVVIAERGKRGQPSRYLIADLRLAELEVPS